jgi:hypothetical protein
MTIITQIGTPQIERDYIGSADYYMIDKGRFVSLISSKLHPVDISHMPAVQRGLAFEPELVKYAAGSLGLSLTEQFEAQGEFEFTRAHIDAWNEKTKTLVEIKTTHDSDWRNNLLPKWLYQVAFQRWCSGAKWCYILVATFSHIGGPDTTEDNATIDSIELLDVTKEQAEIEIDTKALTNFWDEFQRSKTAPAAQLETPSHTELMTLHEQNQLAGIMAELAYYKVREQEFREMLLERMEKLGLKQVLVGSGYNKVQITYTEPTTKHTIDTKELKDKMPDVAEKFTVISPVKASIRITLKRGKKGAPENNGNE